MKNAAIMKLLGNAEKRLDLVTKKAVTAHNDLMEAYSRQEEAVQRLAELGITPETVGGEIERLAAEIEQEINTAA